jgi:hypothetical protein
MAKTTNKTKKVNPRVAAIRSTLETLGRTTYPSAEQLETQREMAQIQLALMKADLRKRNADADLAETNAAGAKLQHQRAVTTFAKRR